jgi:predicted permease
MFENYLKTALRNLKRNKGYAFINVSGLGVGMAAGLLIFLIIGFETSFDNFHKQRKNIFRVGSEFNAPEGVNYSGGAAFPVGAALKLDFPQIKEVATIFKNDDVQVTITNDATHQQKKLQEADFFYAQPSFLKIFDFSWVAGDPEKALSDPNSAVLTQKTAEKYFGDWKSAIGKTIKINNKYLFKVNGILKDIPANTDFPLSVVAAYSSLRNTPLRGMENDWVSTYSDAFTFVVLPPELSPEKLNSEFKAFAKKHKPEAYAKDSYILQPLSEMHYDDRFGNFRSHTFSHELIRALALIGIFLVAIACVNFINLATAQAVNRSKEVGVRKVLGSNRSQLALQFLGETALITLAALAIAICIAATALPFLNSLLKDQITMNFVTNPGLILFLIIIVISVTLLSGLYPATILSGFNPVTALKSKISSKMVGGIALRRALVVLQFAIAQILIIGMLIVVSQMNYFKNASLGFDKAAIINVPMPSDSASRSKMDYLRDQLLANTDIVNASFSFASPSADGNWSSDFKFNHSPKNTDFGANLKWADAAYFKTYGLQFVAGRAYYPNDTVNEFVVNETLVRKLGLHNPEEILGKEINFWDGSKVAKVVGVIKDFNCYSLRLAMAPVVLSTWKNVYQTINIKIKPGSERSVLPFVEKIWNESFPEYVYEYQFLDKTIENFYTQENQLSTLYKIFAGIAIFISCLGLYGLVSFMAVQRTKEVGIRKVLGASSGNIIYLLSREFTLLILIAFLIAAPIAYFIMHNWLQNYSYRISLGVSIFAMAIAGSIIIAWITVGYRAVKAAMANPVKSLRTE